MTGNEVAEVSHLAVSHGIVMRPQDRFRRLKFCNSLDGCHFQLGLRRSRARLATLHSSQTGGLAEALCWLFTPYVLAMLPCGSGSTWEHSHDVASTEAVETVGTGARLFGEGVRGAENIGQNPAQPVADRRNTSMHLQD